MTPERFHAIYPQLISWIEQTLVEHAAQSRPVATLGYKRLSSYFSPALLTATKVIQVERVPVPPLSKLGATGFTAFETREAAGITYLDTFFVNQRYAGDESLHFHELIHVVQWRLLGPEMFLATYADGLERCGYRNSPLETMAYDAQAKFESSRTPFDAEQHVQQLLGLISP